MSPSRMAAKKSVSSSSSPTKRGGVDRGVRRVAQLAMARQVRDRGEVREVEHPVDLVDLTVLDAQRGDELLAQMGRHPALDLEPDHLAEAARCAAPPRRPGAGRRPRPRCRSRCRALPGRASGGPPPCRGREPPGWRRSGPPAAPGPPSSPTCRNRPRSSFGTFTRASTSGLVGASQDHGEAHREVGDVRERAAEPEHQRGQGREDLALEEPSELCLHPAPGSSTEIRRIPCSASAGRRSRATHEAMRPRCADHPLPHGVDLVARAHAVGGSRVHPGLDLVVQGGHPDHEELVQIGLPDGGEADPLQKGYRDVLGQLEDPVVEVQPGQLAVEVERGVLEVGGLNRRRAACLPPLPSWPAGCPWVPLPPRGHATRGVVPSRRAAGRGGRRLATGPTQGDSRPGGRPWLTRRRRSWMPGTSR